MDVGTRGGLGDDLDALTAQVKGGSGLERQDGRNFDTFHVLLNIGTELGSDSRATGEQRGSQRSLGQFGTSSTPSGNFAVHAGDFDLDSTRHSPDNLLVLWRVQIRPLFMSFSSNP